MTFRDFRKDTCAATVLDTDAFAEEVTYIEPSGPSRTVVMKINHDQRIEERDGVEWIVETVRGRCLRDPSHSQGGVDRPIHGAAIIRHTQEDQRRYGYTGHIESIAQHSWTLIFEHQRPNDVGTAQRR